MDLVRKSSGGIDGKLRFENDRAAERRARNDAVRFDLNADFSGLRGCRDACSHSSSILLSSKTPKPRPKSSTSTTIAGADSGWSGNLPGGEETGSRERRVGRALRLLAGMWVVSSDETVSVENDSLSDGIDSKDTVRVERTDPRALSHKDKSSSSRSSGGVSNKSRGPLLKVKLSSFSDSCDLSMIDSTVILFSMAVFDWRMLREDLGGGMLVIASSAATDAGMTSGECMSWDRRDEM